MLNNLDQPTDFLILSINVVGEFPQWGITIFALSDGFKSVCSSTATEEGPSLDVEVQLN